MKKVIVILAILLLIVMIGVLGGCSKSSSTGLSDFMTLEEYVDFVEGKNTGFIFISSEDGEELEKQLHQLRESLKNRNESVVSYNVFKEDGKTLNKSDRQNNPYSDILKIETLNYLEDGELIASYDLDRYDRGSEQGLIDEMTQFIKTYSKSK